MLGLLLLCTGAAAYPFTLQDGDNSLDYISDQEITKFLQQQTQDSDLGYMLEEPTYRDILPTHAGDEHLPWYSDQIGSDFESFWPATDESNPEDILDLSELEENYLQSRLQQSPDEIEKRSREIYETYKLAQDPAISSRKASVMPMESAPTKKAVIPKKFSKIVKPAEFTAEKRGMPEEPMFRPAKMSDPRFKQRRSGSATNDGIRAKRSISAPTPFFAANKQNNSRNKIMSHKA